MLIIEQDYYATIYSAEIINTLTNLLFMYLASKGIHNCLTNGHDTVFLVAYVGYLLVGSGSFLFHATLKCMYSDRIQSRRKQLIVFITSDPMQLVDELSMIYTTCLMCFATFSFGKSRRFSVILGVGLASLALFITLYYHYLQDPTFHQTVYAILTAIVLFRSMYVMEVNIRPRFQSRERHAANPRPNGGVNIIREREDHRDSEILKQMWTMIAYGLSIFLGGFWLWHLDNVHCSTLRRWRREIGMPWGFLLEGHGWWHLMTGIGAYFYIVWGTWLRHCLNDRQDEYTLVWPHLTTMPVVVKQSKPSANGTANGQPKGSRKKNL